MWPALPASEYYGGSAPSQTGRQTVCPARRRPRRMRGARTDLRRFPCSLVDRSAKEAPDLAPATSPRLPRSTSPRPSPHPSDSSGKFPHPRSEAGGYASHPAQIRQVSSRCVFKGRKRRFLAYAFPPRSPDPHHLAVLIRPGFVRAACHPTRHLPGQAALSFAILLRQNHGAGLSPPLNQQALHGAPAGRPTPATAPDNAGKAATSG
jgi:hypothetical protein